MANTTKFLVMGDTHVGYQNRHRSGEAAQQKEINCEVRFCEAIHLGLEHQVDGIIHTGDIFDDEVTDSEQDTVEQQLEHLKRHSIPFYYITGNHENSEGLELLEQYDVAKHLTTDRSMVGNPPVALFGIDHHDRNEFKIDKFHFPLPLPGTTHILVLHQTIMPFRNEGEVNIEELLNKAESTSGLSFDYVLSGHLHDSERHSWNGIEILYTGSTARISKKAKGNNPSAWLLSITDEDITANRQSLPQFGYLNPGEGL